MCRGICWEPTPHIAGTGLHRAEGWATCPITENGFVRVVSNRGYPGRRTTHVDAIDRLKLFQESGDHHFWTDSLTLRDSDAFRAEHLAGPQQLTDVYLLALAVAQQGRLVTFDRSIPITAAAGATPGHLVVLEAEHGSAPT